MPPSTLQARIKAFEALGTGASKQVLDSVAIHSEAEPEHLLDRPHSPTIASIPPIRPTTYSLPASPNSLQHRSSLIDLKDWVIDDGPLAASPATTILSSHSPPQMLKPLPHESAPLISFDGSPPQFFNVPPLPPRKLSFNSLRSVSAPAASPSPTTTSLPSNTLMPPKTDHSYPPTFTDVSPSDGTRRAQGHVQASSVSSLHSVSLSSDGDDSATSGALHSLPMEREWTGTGTEDGESLDESFENVSAPSSFIPPITLPPRPQKPPGQPTIVVATKQPPPQPPKLPQRPVPHSRTSAGSQASPVPSATASPVVMRTPSASSSSPSLTSTRRMPPPPPPPPLPAIPPTGAASASTAAAAQHPPPLSRSRPPSARTSVQSTATTASSDRSSLLSQGTTTSRTSTSSRTSFSASTSTSTPTTPMPPAAKQQSASRARYDALFLANVRAHAHAPKPPAPVPAKRQNAGWRGLSIDIDPGTGYARTWHAPESGSGPASDAAKLDGRLVREIWLKSRLEPQRLRDIWNECDPDGTGSLDRDAFVRGMARIDDELRKTHVLGHSRAGSSVSSTRTPRPVPSRPILR